MPVSEPGHLFFFFFSFLDTSHNATNHGPGDPIFKGKVPFSQRPNIRLDHRLAPIDGGFHCASDDTLFGGVSRAAVSIYLWDDCENTSLQGGSLLWCRHRKFFIVHASRISHFMLSHCNILLVTKPVLVAAPHLFHFNFFHI
jgi:hypothetical protein